MSPLYYGGTDCPTCGATIPQDEPCQICALRARLTEKDREIERLKADAVKTQDGYSRANMDLTLQLSASQAREREAVEETKRLGECLETQYEITRNTAKAANEARGDHFDAESALAAARKALEMIWMQECRCIGMCACDMELAPKMRSIARAALNGDSHAEA